ncbi:hypothetical protein GCM10023322_41220 [Rugosimonospora acidiphila]|uniref:Anti-sigma factor n=1 Tax=Rugosimonospora acidiphila TaxID=556531 RepID=A0ABP9RYC5_9ACTN
MSPISEDDLDRLANYAAGVLDAAEAAEVERLIAGEPAWARAHARLSAAQPRLDEALSGLAGEPMPADLAARLDLAIAATAGELAARRVGPHEVGSVPIGADGAAGAPRVAPRQAGAGALPAAAAPRENAPSPAPTTEPRRVGPEAIPGGAPAPGGGVATVVSLARRRRWGRMAVGAATAAAVVAACFGGLTLLNNAKDPGVSSSSSGAKAAPAVRGGQGPAAVPTTATGTDYTHDTLALAGSTASGRPAASRQAESVPNLPTGLARLAEPAALDGCLAAIMAAEGGRPASVEYARYQGQPAVIVVLAGGSARVVAAGPDCGSPGRGAALLDSLP